MRIAVCVKEVPDTLLNPADRTALELALRMGAGVASSRIEAFSVCDEVHLGALQFALARGVHRVERLPSNSANPVETALVLAHRFAADPFDLICCGDETLDNASAVVGPLVAEFLDLPQVTGVVRVVESDGKKLLVERALDRGFRDLVEMQLPGLISLRAEAAEPHYVSARKLSFARTREIPASLLNGMASPSQTPQWADSEKRIPPRARVKKKFAPDSNLPAAQRVNLIMSGGLGPKSSSRDSSSLEGDPDYLVEQLFRFLKHHEAIQD